MYKMLAGREGKDGSSLMLVSFSFFYANSSRFNNSHDGIELWQPVIK
jgi:hypothetical protein